MSFISLEFVLLFLLCFTLYHFISDKGRKLVLLAASGVFIGYFNPAFLVTALAGMCGCVRAAAERGEPYDVVFLCNPNNPTGIPVKKEEVSV